VKVKLSDKTVELTNEQLTAYKAMTRLQQSVALAHLKGLRGRDLRASYQSGGGRAESYQSIDASVVRILQNVNVSNFVEMFQMEQIERLAETIMSRDEMAQRLTQIARTNINDIMEISNKELFDRNGEIVQQGSWAFKDVESMGGYGAGMINEMTVGKLGTKVKLHDQVAAMKQLSTLMGYDKPQQVEITGEIGVRNVLDDFYATDSES